MSVILVAVDASPIAQHVLDAALAQAQLRGEKLLLLHAVPAPLELPPEALLMSAGDMMALLQRSAEKNLAELASKVPPELLAGNVIEMGVPWRVICSAATEHDASLVVIGAHGHRFMDKILGTTTERVVSHTERSVLIVRAPMEK